MKKTLLLSCVVLATSVAGVNAQNFKVPAKKTTQKASQSALNVQMPEAEVEHEISSLSDVQSLIKEAPASVSSSKSAMMKAEEQTGPIPCYRQPTGSYFYGYSENGYAYNSVRLVTNMDKMIQFVNTSPSAKSTFEWTGFDLDQNPFKSTNKHFLFATGMGDAYYMPHLKETLAGKDSTFILGQMVNKKNNRSIFETFAMTDKDPEGGKFGLTNANVDLGIAAWRFADNQYCFGTGNGMQDALLAVFDKPMGRLYFEGVKIYAGTFEAPANTEFTLRVVTFTVDPEKGIVAKDTLATSVIKASDVTKPNFFTFTFDKFFALDADGFESEVTYIETDEPFMLEFSGFNVPGVKLAVISEREDEDDPVGSSFFYGYNENNERTIYSWTNVRNTMLFNLVDAVVAYMIPEVEEIVADVNGSSHEFKLYPMFSQYWLAEELPSWIKLSVDESNLTTAGYLLFKADIDPLVVKAEGRQGYIKLGTWGAQATIPVTQGEVLSADMAQADIVTAYFQGENLILNYAEGMERVSVYSVNGALIASYELSKNQTMQVSAAGLSKGVYVLKFSGKKEASCKVIK